MNWKWKITPSSILCSHMISRPILALKSDTLNSIHIWSLVIVYLLWHSWGTQWRSWLRRCATSWKVVGSIPNGIIGIFHWYNPSSHNMALGSTQPLKERSTRNTSQGGKGSQCAGLTALPIVLKSGSLNLLEPSRSFQACNGIALAFMAQLISLLTDP